MNTNTTREGNTWPTDAFPSGTARERGGGRRRARPQEPAETK